MPRKDQGMGTSTEGPLSLLPDPSMPEVGFVQGWMQPSGVSGDVPVLVMSFTPGGVREGECAHGYLKEEPQHQCQCPKTEARTNLLGVDTLVRIEPFLLLHLLQLGGRREHTTCVHLDLAGCSTLTPHNNTGF